MTLIPLDPAHFAHLFSLLDRSITQQPASTQQPNLVLQAPQVQPPLQADSFEQGSASGSNEASHNRPSRHPRYQDILTSVQTDDELESTDAKLKMAARRRIYKRRSAQKQGLSPAENKRKRTDSFEKGSTSGAKESSQKRPGRHPQYQDILTSAQTDDELESTDAKQRTAARRRIYYRRSAQKQGLSPAEYARKQKEAAGARKGLSLAEYERKKQEAAAARQGLSLAEYHRKRNEATAAKQGLSLAEYYRKRDEAAAARQGLSMTEFKRKQREAAAAKHRLCSQPNDVQTKKRKRDGEEFQIPNDFWDIHLDELDFEALLEENDSSFPTLSDMREGSTSRVPPDDLDSIDELDFEALLEENGSSSPTLSDMRKGSTSRVLPDDLDCINSLFPERFPQETLLESEPPLDD